MFVVQGHQTKGMLGTELIKHPMFNDPDEGF